MLAVSSSSRIYLWRGSTDMRKSFDGLACLVERELGQNPLSGDYFIFVNRIRDRLRILFWDNGGFCLFSKRLERGRFPVPDACDGLVERSALSLMLDGISVKESRKLPRYTP